MSHMQAQALLMLLRYWMPDCDAILIIDTVLRLEPESAWMDSPAWAEVNAFNLSEALTRAQGGPNGRQGQ